MTKVRNAALALFGAVALSVPSIGMAQGADTGWYVGGSIGQSKFDVDCTGASSCDDSDTAFRVFGGYMFNKNLGIEVGYADLGKLHVAGTVPPFGLVNADLKATAFDVVAVGVLPIASSFSLYGKAGMYRAESKLDGSIAGFGSGSQSDSNTDITVTIGAGYDFNPNFGLRAEWQRYMKVGSDSTGGDGDVDVYSIGVVYRFR